jgi:hypothetical protein
VYYEIGSSSTKNYAGNTSSTTYTHTGLQASTTYYYYIKAVNNAGSSSYSSYASATTSSSGSGGGATNYEPCPVSNPTASGTSSISISWSAATGTGCGTPTSYEVHKQDPNTGVWALKATTSSKSYSESSSNVHPGINRYAIKAVNSYGTSAANYAFSSEVPLSTPTGFTASKSGSNVTFSWSKVAAATGYQIFESTSANGTYFILDEINENKTTHTRYYPASGTTRYFKIKARWMTSHGSPTYVDSNLSSYKSVTF